MLPGMNRTLRSIPGEALLKFKPWFLKFEPRILEKIFVSKIRALVFEIQVMVWQIRASIFVLLLIIGLQTCLTKPDPVSCANKALYLSQKRRKNG